MTDSEVALFVGAVMKYEIAELVDPHDQRGRQGSEDGAGAPQEVEAGLQTRL